MKTIGFIDYFIDEWHANNYPRMIRESRLGNAFDVALAWQETEMPGKQGLEDWCAEQGVRPARSVREVVDNCDTIVVLSPDNGERHEDLADIPLRSGKPVYVDKPFALTRPAAERMFAKADRHGTPLMSCSALRCAPPLIGALNAADARPVTRADTRGPGSFAVYAVHQLEMIVMALGVGAARLRKSDEPTGVRLDIDYDGGRQASVLQGDHPFGIRLETTTGTVELDDMGEFFPRFIDRMLEFFGTGISPIPPAETVEIAALIEAGAAALERPGTWVAVP
jgi:predicted dehydrogenase